MFGRIFRAGPAGGSSVRASLPDRVLAAQQRRTFSQSPTLARAVIHFPKTSSTELDELLDTIRYKVILPSYLPVDQRKRLYNRKYKTQLEADPITMEIDGEKLRFYYTDKVRGVPSTKKSLYDIIRLMKTPDDWAILPRLLEGLCVQAGRKLSANQYSKIIRRASMAGCIHTILTCAREVRRTNFRLDSHEKANDVLINIQVEPILAGWDAAETEKALQRAERVLAMLEEPDHQAPARKTEAATSPKRTYPLHKDPLFLGARLHLAAAVAAKHNGGADADGKVAKYARELVALWPEGRGVHNLYGADPGVGHLQHPSQIIYTAGPVLHGLRLAAQVVEGAHGDAQLAEQLLARGRVLEKDLAMALENTVDGSRRMLEVYNKLFPDSPVPVREAEEQEAEQPGRQQAVQPPVEA